MKQKRCTKCNKYKNLDEYYCSKDRYRSECKECTIKHNAAYQKRRKKWLERPPADEKTRAYQRDYYSRNKHKFRGYRIKFKMRHPHYYEKWLENRQKKQGAGNVSSEECRED